MLRAQPLQVTPDGDICGRGDPPESLFERNAVAGPYCIDALLLFAAEPSVDPTSLEKTWDFLESRIVRYDPDIDMEDWRCDDDLAVIRCLRRIVSAQKLPFLDDNSWTSHVLRLIKSRVLALPRRARRLKESDLGRRDIRIGVMSLVLDIVALQAPRTAFDVVHLLAHLPEWGFHGGTPLASYHPSQWERAPTTPVGLKNQGATCYMNSFLQLLFSTASFREGILSEPIADPPVSHPDQLLAELKVVFGQLLASHRKWHDPVSLCQALRDDMGEFLNNWNEQKDVHEFANSIMDQLLPDGQSHSRIGPTERDRGCLVNQMISQECRHRSERLEPFFTASLTVANNANLAASLSLFVEGEVLETDNKWMCAECNQKVPAIKRTCFQASSLPEHLILHLKRFEYDFDAMRKFKINDYFEFPMEFSMLPFTDVGIDNTGDGSDDEYLYRLVGVLVHTGVADAGHYYMFGSHSDGRWFQWNDAVVTEFDVNQLPAECFGGVDPGGNMRPNSAYLLLYDRVLLAGKRRERVVSLAAVPSQVQNLVKVSNVQFAREKQLFDSRFMTWLWHLIDLSWPGLLRGYNSLHTRYAALDEPCDKGASDESELGLAESETGENCVALAMQYTTEVVIRSVDCSSFPYWLWLIQRMISVSKRAAVWVVHKVAEDMPWFRLFSMQFPIADGRCAFIDLVIGALQRVGADDPHVRQFLSNIVRDVLPSHTEVLRLLRGLSSLPGYADLLLSLNALDKVVGMLLKPDSLPAPGSWLDHVSYISTHLVHQCLNRNSSLPEALHQDKTWGYLLEDQITWTGQHVGRPFIAVAARIARATGADPFIKRAVAGLTISHTRRSFRLRLLSELVSDAIDTGSASTLDRILTRMMALMDQCLASGATHDALLLDCLHWTTTHAFSAGPVAAWLHDHPATWQRVASAIVSAGPSS
ncbi:USP domain-containing protein [Plasmodiophora brassicae]